MKAQIPWLRVFVEGVVIVGSILLAFGLQAWWEERIERAEEERIERVGLELMHADLVADTFEIKSVIRYAQFGEKTRRIRLILYPAGCYDQCRGWESNPHGISPEGF